MKKPMKIICAILIIAAIAVAAYFVYDAITNTYKTPIKIMEKMENLKKYPGAEKVALDQLNGFAVSEYKEVLKYLKKADGYKEMDEKIEKLYEQQREQQEETYGSNFKIKYEIEDKEKLDKDELKDFQENLRDLGEKQLDLIEKTEDYDADEWEEKAEDAGLSVSDMKKLQKAYEKMGKKFKSVKVTDGYELSVKVTITGSKLDDPKENETKIKVYKVDGRWVTATALGGLIGS